jgi:hypothetical protein
MDVQVLYHTDYSRAVLVSCSRVVSISAEEGTMFSGSRHKVAYDSPMRSLRSLMILMTPKNRRQGVVEVN